MFVALSQIVRFFTLPSNLMALFGIMGCLFLLFTHRKRLGQGMIVASLVMLAVAGWTPLGNWLIDGLEDRFPAWDASRGAPDGIVILGGAISPEVSKEHNSIALNESAERMTVVADLARRFPQARIVFTGGGSRRGEGPVEADFVLPLFDSFGIARDRVMLEALSHNTAENAKLTKGLVQPKQGERWLLVTSAYHMPRAVGAFRQVGFPVEAYPVDWRTGGDDDFYFTSLSAGLARTDTALREWAGLVGYRLTGRTDALWPGP